MVQLRLKRQEDLPEASRKEQRRCCSRFLAVLIQLGAQDGRKGPLQHKQHCHWSPRSAATQQHQSLTFGGCKANQNVAFPLIYNYFIKASVCCSAQLWGKEEVGSLQAPLQYTKTHLVYRPLSIWLWRWAKPASLLTQLLKGEDGWK